LGEGWGEGAKHSAYSILRSLSGREAQPHGQTENM
jgi:hypothetical protein